jgi:glycerophosphoryl diester phosphodiesterase
MARPLIIAHRGASGHAPENTIAAYRLAIELGSHFIEADLQVCSDGHIVAIHDAVLQRTTNGRGTVAESTLAELRTIDAGRWFDRDFAGQRLSTLEEVLGLSREAEIGFYFQVGCPFTAEFGRSLIDAVRTVDAIGRVVVVSSDPTALAALGKLDDAAISCLLIEAAQPHSDAVEKAARCGARQVCLREDLVTAEVVNCAHQAGLLAVAWTVNPPGRMRALLSTGVDRIVTDFPDRLRAIIEDADAQGREPGSATDAH